MKSKKQKKISRHRRIRSKISGTPQRPRLTIFKSNRHLFVQLIDDEKSMTLVSASAPSNEAKTAKDLGALIAKKAAEKKIVSVVFDRGGYKYHGLIKELAEEARGGGLKF